MQGVNPRRSACDRCRSHKLRCVRLDQSTGGPEGLMACQRCLRAGTNCVHTIHLHRRPTRDGQPSIPYQHHDVDQQMKDFSFDLTAAAAPAQRRTSRPDENASPPSHIFAHHTSAAPHVGTHKHRSPEFISSIITPPGSDHESLYEGRRGGNGGGSGAGSAFCTVPGLSAHDNAANSAAAAAAAAAHHMMQYPQVTEPLTMPNYFDTTTSAAATVAAVDAMATSGSHQSLEQHHHQQQQQQQQHPIQHQHQQPQIPINNRSSSSSTEDHLHQLSQLSSRLLVDFGKTGSSSTGGEVNQLSSTVTKLFESLQLFLDTVECLRPRPQATVMHSSAASECSYSSQWDESEFMHITPEPAGNGAAPPPAPSALDGVTPDKPVLDLPATLTILTCYIWLLKGYETVLSGIREALTAHVRGAKTNNKKVLPSILSSAATTGRGRGGTGALFGGFALENHPDMQIEIVVHMGSQLLHRIEGVLQIHVLSEGPPQQQLQQQQQQAGPGGIVDPYAAVALLDIWLPKTDGGGDGKHGMAGITANSAGITSDSGGGEDPYGGRRMQIHRTVDEIRGLLRDYWRDCRA